MIKRNSKGQFVKGCIPSSKGTYRTKEVKKKISESIKKGYREGRKPNRYWLGKHNPTRYWLGKHNPTKYWLGRHHSEETKKKISKSTKGKSRPRQRGRLNYNWKGGITPENVEIRRSIEGRLWRESVFARDNFTCQKCKIKGGTLNAHHIFDFSHYPQLRFAIDNGITFCKKCHKLFHKKYGYKNNQEQLEEFLKI